MATWKDGPEYAPRERPAAFEVPDVAPLPDPAPVASAQPEPTIPPVSYEVAAHQPTLASIAVLDRHPRDPAEPFDTVAATIAPGESRPAGEPQPTTRREFDPLRPMNTGDGGPGKFGRLGGRTPVSTEWAAPTGTPAYPSPGTLEWFAPPAPRAPIPPAHVRPAAWFAAITPFVLVCFIAGIIVAFIAPVAGVAYLLGYAGTFLIRHRGGPVRVLGTVLLGAQLFAIFLAMAAEGATVLSICRIWNPVAAVSCLIELAVAAVLTYRSLQAREQPR